MSDTATIPRPELTAEERARRNRIVELRLQIAELARYRTAMNRAFRLPHLSDEWAAALRVIGYQTPNGYVMRRDKRDTLTRLHVELADLRGKVHLAGSQL
jgi:hypothetical protein